MRTDSYTLTTERIVPVNELKKAFIVTDIYGNIIFSRGALVKRLLNFCSTPLSLNILNTTDPKNTITLESAMETARKSSDPYKTEIEIEGNSYELTSYLLEDDYEQSIVFDFSKSGHQRSSEKLTKRNEDKLEALIENLTDFKYALDKSAIVSMTDAKGTITYVNQKFCDISKFRAEELIGENHNIINSGYHSREFFKEMWKTIGNGKIWEGEIKNKAKDGSFYWMKSTIVPFMDKNGKPLYYLSIRVDITKTKLYEEKIKHINRELENKQKLLLVKNEKLVKLTEQLKESEKNLKQANEEKDKFLSIIAHDLRNPFHGILGMAHLLKTEFANFEINDREELIDNIHSALNNVYRLVENLLDWARLSNNSLEAEPEKFSLGQKVKEVTDYLLVNAEKKKVSVIDNTNPECFVYADERMIGSVIQNLLTNAIKFTPQEGKVEISTSCHKTFSELIIEDTGVGIPPEVLSKIFKINHKNSTKGTDNEIGSGLGLLICKELLDKNMGDIKVVSKENKGTKFTIRLPLYK